MIWVAVLFKTVKTTCTTNDYGCDMLVFAVLFSNFIFIVVCIYMLIKSYAQKNISTNTIELVISRFRQSTSRSISRRSHDQQGGSANVNSIIDDFDVDEHKIKLNPLNNDNNEDMVFFSSSQIKTINNKGIKTKERLEKKKKKISQIKRNKSMKQLLRSKEQINETTKQNIMPPAVKKPQNKPPPPGPPLGHKRLTAGTLTKKPGPPPPPSAAAKKHKVPPPIVSKKVKKIGSAPSTKKAPQNF